jgi:hypothetical protein
MRVTWPAGAAFAAALVGCAGAAPAPVAPAGPPVHVDAQPRIVTAAEVTTEPELARRAERALMEQRWRDAVDAYRTLLAADATGTQAPEYAFDLALALEGMQERAQARDAFLDVARRFPDGPRARSALVRAASLDAYLEDWSALEGIGETLLARADIDDLDRLVALGSRGLARVELGEAAVKSGAAPPASERANDAAAAKDVYDGLELADTMHYGARDVLPVAVAQLRFALGELRRVRSERIVFLDPMQPDFLERFSERCGLLLEAQEAYAMAVRSIDPHWAAMSGYRVGEMYRLLHRDLMRIPAPPQSKTERQKQIFYAFMHVRYRVFLEKGIKQIEETIALGERTADTSPWIQRARDAKAALVTALEDEKAQLAKMPFTEDEVKAAMELLRKRELARHPAPPSTPRSAAHTP